LHAAENNKIASGVILFILFYLMLSWTLDSHDFRCLPACLPACLPPSILLTLRPLLNVQLQRQSTRLAAAFHLPSSRHLLPTAQKVVEELLEGARNTTNARGPV
jgi:hypothetical protein